MGGNPLLNFSGWINTFYIYNSELTIFIHSKPHTSSHTHKRMIWVDFSGLRIINHQSGVDGSYVPGEHSDNRV